MSESPSNRRRKGRNFYDPNCTPEDLSPYLYSQWARDYYHPDFVDGWNEAKAQRAKDKADAERNVSERCSACPCTRQCHLP